MKLGNCWMHDLVLEARRQGLKHDTSLRPTAVVFLWGTGLSSSPIWPPCLCLEGNGPFQRFQTHIFHFKLILPLWMYNTGTRVCVYIWVCMRLVWVWHKEPRRAGPCCHPAGHVPSLVAILPHPAGCRPWVGLATVTDRFLLWTAFRWSDVEARTALGLCGKLGLGAPVCSGAVNCMDTLSRYQGMAIAAPGVAGMALNSKRGIYQCTWPVSFFEGLGLLLLQMLTYICPLLSWKRSWYMQMLLQLFGWVFELHIFFWLSSPFSCCDLGILGLPDHCWVIPLWGKTQSRQPYSWLFKCISPFLSTVGHPGSW